MTKVAQYNYTQIMRCPYDPPSWPYCGGLLDYITSNVTVGASLTQAAFEEFIRNAFRYGRKMPTYLSGEVNDRDILNSKYDRVTLPLKVRMIDDFTKEVMGFYSIEHLNSMLDVGGAYCRRPELIFSHRYDEYDLDFRDNVVDMDEKIKMLEPDASPLMTLLMKMHGKGASHSHKIDWLDQELLPRTSILAGVTAYSGPIWTPPTSGKAIMPFIYDEGTIRRYESHGTPTTYADWDLRIRQAYGEIGEIR